ncbi:MAG: hypothetical protein NC928_02360 [Candidatus Omnitrophica bacterium]|nr:hypothetical protein [Candidatus Omnitrophota bacterium]
MKTQKISLKKDLAILWKDLLDLGVMLSLSRLRKKVNKELALKELNLSLCRQSEEHWQALYNSLKKLR